MDFKVPLDKRAVRYNSRLIFNVYYWSSERYSSYTDFIQVPFLKCLWSRTWWSHQDPRSTPRGEASRCPPHQRLGYPPSPLSSGLVQQINSYHRYSHSKPFQAFLIKPSSALESFIKLRIFQGLSLWINWRLSHKVVVKSLIQCQIQFEFIFHLTFMNIVSLHSLRE